MVGCNGIRHVETEDRVTRGGFDDATGAASRVAVAEVVAAGGEVFFTECLNRFEGGRGDVEDGNGVGLLERDHGLGAVWRNREIFRFKIGGRHAIIENADTGCLEGGGLRIKGREVGGLNRSGNASSIHRDDAHAPLRSIRHSGLDGNLRCGKLTFVANQQLGAVRSEGDVIRNDSDNGGADQRTRSGVEDNDVAIVGLRIVDDCCGEDVGISTGAFADGDGGNIVAGQTRDTKRGGHDGGEECGGSRIGEIHDLNASARRSKGTLRGRVERRDF